MIVQRQLLKFLAQAPNSCIPNKSWATIGVRCLQTKENPTSSSLDRSTVKTFTLSDQTKSEVKHHASLANYWWDPLGPIKALHALNKLRIPFICEGLKSQHKISSELINTTQMLKNQNILEIGCGGGILTESLARIGSSVTALDLSEDLIALARHHLALEQNQGLVDRVQYKIEPIEHHASYRKNYYDAVVISEVLEHVDENDKIEFLRASVETLKPGGSMFITTLNKTISMWVVGVLIGEYILRAIPIGTHHYGKMISPEYVRHILNTLNCDTVLVKGSSYNFLRNYWSWTNTTSLFYALHAVKK
ncbi:ubiquinone biosynthesis O-methyltransferase, mitochondrial [Stomoxys calcitrans]|uniref:ubiquinone biosynthesis O-methyltransferase, mitochondrial n=1 Tax=Stomoxys calcitrans TaxID=35570 RepID=UPI0027E3A51A|nr:ubiquinone biosynthesis O-methyltransferase, mitochondrial [Stomoxys calcitrans]